MTTLMLLTPFLISLWTGTLLVAALTRRSPQRDPLINLFLGGGLGLGLSAYPGLLSLPLFNGFCPAFALAVNLLWLVIAVGLWIHGRQHGRPGSQTNPRPWKMTLTGLVLLALSAIPAWFYARLYPFGGWDAWQVWNYKAKFLLLAGPRWPNLFAPDLWQTSPHYPLLLPGINLWGWTLINRPVPLGPLWTSLIITLLSAGLLFAALRRLTRGPVAVLTPLLLMTLPFFLTLATSQYCDGLIGYLFLAVFFCLLSAKGQDSRPHALLAGLSLGLLSFTKPEGTITALLIAGLGIIHLRNHQTPLVPAHRSTVLTFAASSLLGLTPTLLFKFFLSPGNQNFINGLTSTEAPATLFRLKMIGAFLGVELISGKWNGLWILILGGILLAGRRGFRKDIRIIPAFLVLYLGIVLAYYFVNTDFEITWWLQVTLNRILFSLLPLTLFWIGLGMFGRPARGADRDKTHAV